MTKKRDEEVENFLKEFSLKPAPPAMKNKILENTLRKRESNHMISPLSWKGLAGCLFLLILVIAIDAAISHYQHKRFSSYLNKQQDTSRKQEEDWSLLKDIILESLGTSREGVKAVFFRSEDRERNKKRQKEWKESFKEEFE
jgi:hypothetical protein